eukprot:TRINITY_DN7551_c0_g1_i4.p2 TRINITY_DN7551_c0_g1~~TRINITY_DN7551_c0_g1_i4.p2  ORF type:complete len:194 (+),score=27.80 TRINITY_DN7551_c0_g1_i4:1646-2227(+)
MEFQYSKDGKELDEYYADLRRQHEADCQAYNKPSDCHALGEFYETVDKNFAKAAEVFHGLCNRKYGRSCYRLGSMHMAGRGVDQDVKAAFDHFEKACEYGNVEGCHNVGMILRSKNAAGIAQDGPRALSLFQSACDKDFRNGCFMASVMLLKGDLAAFTWKSCASIIHRNIMLALRASAGSTTSKRSLVAYNS